MRGRKKRTSCARKFRYSLQLKRGANKKKGQFVRQGEKLGCWNTEREIQKKENKQPGEEKIKIFQHRYIHKAQPPSPESLGSFETPS